MVDSLAAPQQLFLSVQQWSYLYSGNEEQCNSKNVGGGSMHFALERYFLKRMGFV